jgi:serine protease Do
MKSMFPRRARAAVPFRRAHRVALLSGVALTLAFAPAIGPGIVLARAAEAPAAASTGTPSLAPLVERVMPAVVNISVDEKSLAADDQDDQDSTPPSQQNWSQQPWSMPGTPQGTPFDDLLRRFFQGQGGGFNAPQMQQPIPHETALGSGFIIDPSGLVVTNNHVVDGGRKVTVVLQDGRKFTAKVLGRDPKTDLALLKIEAHQTLPYVSWGDSSTARPGDWVVAVGNPFGLGGTVSAGIVSARGRDIHEGPYDDFLQIDAPINRGNSGGPTFNLDGQVIGINTAIYSPSGGSVGIGFAIPSNLAKSVVAQLKANGKVSRGWLGVQIQGVTPAIAKALGLPDDHGALVDEVTKDSPADKAGIREGDVIEAYDGHAVDKMRDLPLTVAQTPVGNAVKVKIWRKDQALTLDLTIAQQPADLEMASNGSGGEEQSSAPFGLHLGALTAERREQLKVPDKVEGVVVRSIAGSSPLADIDLVPGDVIETINQHPVKSPDEAAQRLREADAAPQKRLLMLVNRHGQNEYLAWSQDANQG